MSESLLLFLLGGLLPFVAVVAIAYLVVRFAFIGIAERISAQMAVHIESVAPRAASEPHLARAGKASAAAGRKSQDLAAARGINVGQAKAVLLARLERTARLMDSKVRLPPIGGIGLDPLLGLIPYAGDVVSATVAGAIVLNSL